jgi:hypothetical protein
MRLEVKSDEREYKVEFNKCWNCGKQYCTCDQDTQEAIDEELTCL